MRAVFEAVSKRVGLDQYEFQGKKGRWRMVKGNELFFPDDGSAPMGMPHAMKAASKKRGASKPTLSSALRSFVDQQRRSRNKYGLANSSEIISKYPRKKDADSVFKKWMEDSYEDWSSWTSRDSKKEKLENFKSWIEELESEGKNAGLFKDDDQGAWDWAYIASKVEGNKDYEMAGLIADVKLGMSSWADLIH